MGTLLMPVSRPQQWAAIKRLILDVLDSDHSRRAYERPWDEFACWYTEQPTAVGFTKASVQAYRAHLQEQDLALSTINQRRSAHGQQAHPRAGPGVNGGT